MPPTSTNFQSLRTRVVPASSWNSILGIGYGFLIIDLCRLSIAANPKMKIGDENVELEGLRLADFGLFFEVGTMAKDITLYNLGKAEESVSQLLIQLIDTTSDASIKSYDRALRFYSDKLNETWS